MHVLELGNIMIHYVYRNVAIYFHAVAIIVFSEDNQYYCLLQYIAH